MKTKILLLALIAFLGIASFASAQVPSYVPASNLIGWYPFNGNANDASGNGNNGTLLNGITLTNDRYGYANAAYYIDGVDVLPARGLSLPVNLLNGSDYSISVWMQTTNTGKIRQTVFNSNPHAIQLLNYNHTVSPGIMGGWISDGTEPWGITGATNNFTMPAYNTWNNVVMVKTAAEVKYYVNGTLTRTQPIGPIGNTAFNLFFGSIGFDGGIGQHSFEGNLDDIGVWNRALTPYEIDVLHQSTFAAPTLIAPLNGATGISTSPTFDWADVPFATKYHLQVSTLADFSVLLINKNDLTVSNYTPPAPLALNTTYYWRVYAGDNYGWSYASGAWSFTSMPAPPWSLYQTGVPYSLFGVDFSTVNNSIGVAVGQGGTVIKTTDAGEEWTLTYQNINIWMNDVQFDPNVPGQVWAAGMGGVIIRSNDNGDTWTVVRPFSTPDHTIRGIAVKPGPAGYVSFVGYAGTFFETNNNGATFTQRFDIPFTMHSIAYSPNFTIDGRGIIAGTDGKVWNTTNFGANWIARNTYRYDYMNDVVFLTPDVAMICGNNGTILRSTNWGKTWSVNVQYLTSEHLRSIDAFGGTKVTVCGDNGKIMTANDAGITFVDQLNGENRHFYGVALRSNNIGVVVGEIGTAGNGTGAPLYYTSMNGGTVGITQIGTETPKNFSLGQNYPNPFNPTTKINFAIPKQGMVTLKVYDMLGKEVKTLVNEVKSAGSYTVDFNGSQLSSGVYFYKIQTSEFTEVKRMMLVK